MGTFKGLFELKTPRDLLNKLRRDYQRMQQSPDDQDMAFNFFVTAEHMVDWMYPHDRAEQKRTRRGDIYLEICSHIANGSKHFEATDKRHEAVKDAVVRRTRGAWPGAFWPNQCWPNEPARRELVIVLKGSAQTKLGKASMGVLELAQKVLEIWEKRAT